MKSIFSLFLLINVLLVLFTSPILACWGFRPMGMGGVFVAVADDANLAYWNRAGSALLDDWKDGQMQIATSSLFLNQKKFFDRTERVGNPYYDSFNFAQKINNSLGWSFASVYNGGGSFALTPGIGFKIWDGMALGLGYYYWINESYGVLNNNVIRLNAKIQQIHLDYLWKIHPEFNFGVHIERFWQLDYLLTSPDVGGSVSESGKIAESMNFRPGIAWLPRGILKGLIVNTGVYDLFAQGGGPHFSLGFEYAPPSEVEKTKTVKVKGKGKKVEYKKEVTIEKVDNFLTHSAFRGGLYNLAGKDAYSLITLGYGYKINNAFEIGYWGSFGISQAASGSHSHELGIAWTF